MEHTHSIKMDLKNGVPICTLDVYSLGAIVRTLINV
jgi:hypothetical protein